MVMSSPTPTAAAILAQSTYSNGGFLKNRLYVDLAKMRSGAFLERKKSKELFRKKIEKNIHFFLFILKSAITLIDFKPILKLKKLLMGGF
jgi:hypothetical protein